MFLIICVAGFTTIATVGLSYAIQSRKTEKVVYSKPGVTRLAKEQVELATAIVVDLRRALNAKKLTSEVVGSAFIGYQRIASTSWIISRSQLSEFKYHYLVEFVEPFLNSLESAIDLQGEDPTEEFAELLIEIIEKTVPVAANFLLRGDTGERFSVEGYNLRESIRPFSNKIKVCNGKKLAVITTMPQTNAR